MFLTHTTTRSTVFVCVALVCAFIFTGFVSASYHRERSRLGEEHFENGQKESTGGEYGGAAEEYRKALLFTPDSRAYRLALATSLVRADKLDEAQSHVEQLLQEDPTNGQINLLLARIAVRQHHPNLAIDSYQRAVYEYWPPEEVGKRRQARWELIQLLEEQGGKRRNDLIGELLQLYGNLPAASDQRMRVGETLLKNGADAEASTVFRDVLKGSPQDLGAHQGLAQVAFRAGDYLQARHEYQRVLRSSPNLQAAQKGLQLTNEIIDMAPQLPNISETERVRRSANLLSRVKTDVEACNQAGGGDADSPLRLKLDEVANLLSAKNAPADDRAASLQAAAQELWRERATLCQGGLAADPAIETVLPRLIQ